MIALAIICFLLFFNAGISTPALASDVYIIKLESTRAAKFQVVSVTNDPEALPISGALLERITVSISCGDFYYTETASKMQEPVTPIIPIAADERIVIDVVFYFDADADNRSQGVPYKLLWVFYAEVDEEREEKLINMTGGGTLHSNLNINPGDIYDFSIIVENGNPEPIPTPTPTPTLTPTPTPTPLPHDPGPPNSVHPDRPTSPDNPDGPGDLDDLGAPNDSMGIQTGDYTTAAKNGTSLPLLITSTVFLLCIIYMFIRVILAERKRQAG